MGSFIQSVVFDSFFFLSCDGVDIFFHHSTVGSCFFHFHSFEFGGVAEKFRLLKISGTVKDSLLKDPLVSDLVPLPESLFELVFKGALVELVVETVITQRPPGNMGIQLRIDLL